MTTDEGRPLLDQVAALGSPMVEEPLCVYEPRQARARRAHPATDPSRDR